MTGFDNNWTCKVDGKRCPGGPCDTYCKRHEEPMLPNEEVSVLQGWVMELPLREQGVLLTAVRGCDLSPKNDNNLGSVERRLQAFLRYCFLNPADPREVDAAPGCWFLSDFPCEADGSEQPKFRPSGLMHYPLHWYSHVMHAFEVVANRHPDKSLAWRAANIYLRMCSALHLNPEHTEDYKARLSEDRMVVGEVVS